MLRVIWRLLVKITGLPQLYIYLRPKIYYESKRAKKHHLHGGIIISNHTSIIDYFTLQGVFPFKHQRFLISEVIYNQLIPGLMAKSMGEIVVHRERADLSFMDEAVDSIKKRKYISIFPEGHLSKNKKIDEFKPSTIYLAIKANCKIIPCYIDAHYNSLHRTRIIIGEAFDVKKYCASSSPNKDEIIMLTNLLRKKVCDLKNIYEQQRKYKTRSLLNIKAWFLDLVKIILWLPNKIVFPTIFHYVDGASYKDRLIKGSGIIASNHLSFVDPPILAIHYFSRRVHIIIAEELYRHKPWLLSHLFAINYRREQNKADLKCFFEIINILKAGGVVGIYPEGHIKENSKIENLNSGTAYFSLVSNTPIFLYYMARKFKPFRFNHVFIGKTIHPSCYFSKQEMNDKNKVSKLNKIINDELNKIEFLAKKYSKNFEKS